MQLLLRVKVKIRFQTQFTENNSTGKYATFAFTKATIADNQTPTAKSNITGVNIKWTPTPTK